MTPFVDGPISPDFFPVPLRGNTHFEDLTPARGLSEGMAKVAEHAPRSVDGQPAVGWGIPFQIDDPVLLINDPVSVAVEPFQAGWLIFLHTSDGRRTAYDNGKLVYPDPKEPYFRGEGRLNEHAADYVIQYADGSEARLPIRRRMQVGIYDRRWGENCFEAVPFHKPIAPPANYEQPQPYWGPSQMRADASDYSPWTAWLWAWQNPHPEKIISGLRFESVCGALVISAVSAGEAGEHPLRWRTRRKAVLHLPEGLKFEPKVDEDGRLGQIQLDMGQVISARPRLIYPNEGWAGSYNNQLPKASENELLVEYTSHTNARFHLWNGDTLPVTEIETSELQDPAAAIRPINPATRRVNLRVVEKGSGRLVAVKLHAHGQAGEYLAPVDRHRIANPLWFEDYSTDFMHNWQHTCTYIPGETIIDLPLGPVYLEISKGFEIRPVRQVVEITAATEALTIEIEKVLAWRERGWVTADTHVHFLSTGTAMLEGAAEGVNVINLLASQWGELMTNVGDFDGRTTWGAGSGAGPEQNGEYLVRVGTENRQHVLGHISLLGYRGRIIAPMTTGGPDESALGDPVEILLTEWARQCRQQGGLVVLPHFPEPRAEHAASIVAGEIDALEMTSWGNLYGGIDPYSLADWYRYLNCGYFVAAVGGTDKMTADTAVGTVRTYAHIPPGKPFTYEAWMETVRRGETFVTYGPLLDFSIDGKPMGSRISLPRGGGTLSVTWQVASATVPATKVELVINGVVRESAHVSTEGGPSGSAGVWSVKVDESAWLALLVRGHYPDQPEIVAAHSSPVMVSVEGSQLLAAADGVTILEQIEGALAYLDTVGTRAEDKVYKRMQLVLQSAHRELHNRMHQAGHYHEH